MLPVGSYVKHCSFEADAPDVFVDSFTKSIDISPRSDVLQPLISAISHCRDSHTAKIFQMSEFTVNSIAENQYLFLGKLRKRDMSPRYIKSRVCNILRRRLGIIREAHDAVLQVVSHDAMYVVMSQL